MYRIRPYNECNWIFTIEDLNNSPMLDPSVNLGSVSLDINHDRKKYELLFYARLSKLIRHTCRNLRLPFSVIFMSHILLHRVRQMMVIFKNEAISISTLLIQIACRHLDYRVPSDHLVLAVCQSEFGSDKHGKVLPPIDNKDRRFQELKQNLPFVEKHLMNTLAFDFQIVDYAVYFPSFGMPPVLNSGAKRFFESISLTQISIMYYPEDLIVLSIGMFFFKTKEKLELFPTKIHVTSDFLYQLVKLAENIIYFQNNEREFLLPDLTGSFDFTSVTQETVEKYFKERICTKEQEKAFKAEIQKKKDDINALFKEYYGESYDPRNHGKIWSHKTNEIKYSKYHESEKASYQRQQFQPKSVVTGPTSSNPINRSIPATTPLVPSALSIRPHSSSGAPSFKTNAVKPILLKKQPPPLPMPFKSISSNSTSSLIPTENMTVSQKLRFLSDGIVSPEIRRSILNLKGAIMNRSGHFGSNGEFYKAQYFGKIRKINGEKLNLLKKLKLLNKRSTKSSSNFTDNEKIQQTDIDSNFDDKLQSENTFKNPIWFDEMSDCSDIDF